MVERQRSTIHLIGQQHVAVRVQRLLHCGWRGRGATGNGSSAKRGWFPATPASHSITALHSTAHSTAQRAQRTLDGRPVAHALHVFVVPLKLRDTGEGSTGAEHKTHRMLGGMRRGNGGRGPGADARGADVRRTTACVRPCTCCTQPTRPPAHRPETHLDMVHTAVLILQPRRTQHVAQPHARPHCGELAAE